MWKYERVLQALIKWYLIPVLFYSIFIRKKLRNVINHVLKKTASKMCTFFIELWVSHLKKSSRTLKEWLRRKTFWGLLM